MRFLFISNVGRIPQSSNGAIGRGSIPCKDVGVFQFLDTNPGSYVLGPSADVPGSNIDRCNAYPTQVFLGLSMLIPIQRFEIDQTCFLHDPCI
jgi:hypothetical protein